MRLPGPYQPFTRRKPATDRSIFRRWHTLPMRLVFRQPKRADDTTGNRGTGTGGKFSGIPEPSRCPRTGQKIKRGSDSIAESEPFSFSGIIRDLLTINRRESKFREARCCQERGPMLGIRLLSAIRFQSCPAGHRFLQDAIRSARTSRHPQVSGRVRL